MLSEPELPAGRQQIAAAAVLAMPAGHEPERLELVAPGVKFLGNPSSYLNLINYFN